MDRAKAEVVVVQVLRAHRALGVQEVFLLAGVAGALLLELEPLAVRAERVEMV